MLLMGVARSCADPLLDTPLTLQPTAAKKLFQLTIMIAAHYAGPAVTASYAIAGVSLCVLSFQFFFPV